MNDKRKIRCNLRTEIHDRIWQVVMDGVSNCDDPNKAGDLKMLRQPLRGELLAEVRQLADEYDALMERMDSIVDRATIATMQCIDEAGFYCAIQSRFTQDVFAAGENPDEAFINANTSFNLSGGTIWGNGLAVQYRFDWPKRGNVRVPKIRTERVTLYKRKDDRAPVNEAG